MSDSPAHRLRLRFDERRASVRRLLELARRQQELVSGEDYASLLDVLALKQRVLLRLDERQSRDPPLVETWRDLRGRLDPDDRAACEALLAETQTDLDELLTLERTCSEQLREQRDATRLRLEHLASCGRVHDAYRDASVPSPLRRLDVDR
jgi:hypothetical protein